MRDCIKEVTELIQKLVPGIMEFKEGCRVKMGDDTGLLIEINNNNGIRYFGTYFNGFPFSLTEDMLCDTIVNLGRDIHLEDVMLAINIKIDSALPDYVCTSGGALLAMDGEFACDTDFSKMISYDLYSPFTEQSEEFYQFIIKALR